MDAGPAIAICIGVAGIYAMMVAALTAGVIQAFREGLF